MRLCLRLRGSGCGSRGSFHGRQPGKYRISVWCGSCRGCLSLQGTILYSGCGSAVGDGGALHGGTVCDHCDDQTPFKDDEHDSD